QPILPAIIVAAQPAIVVVAAHFGRGFFVLRVAGTPNFAAQWPMIRGMANACARTWAWRRNVRRRIKPATIVIN
ncbi:hypothetical protein, partial [Novosphingobium album (ex Liu et al. 2023)]